MIDEARFLTDHAAERYCRRIHRGASRADAQDALDRGTWQTTPPGRMTLEGAGDAAGYVVAPDRVAVFVMKRGMNGRLAAVTCLRRHTVSKADKRARREAARDELAA